MHKDLFKALNNELEVCGAMQSTNGFTELVGAIVRDWIRDQDQQEFQTRYHERTLGIPSCDREVNRERPWVLVVLEYLHCASSQQAVNRRTAILRILRACPNGMQKGKGLVFDSAFIHRFVLSHFFGSGIE